MVKEVSSNINSPQQNIPSGPQSQNFGNRSVTVATEWRTTGMTVGVSMLAFGLLLMTLGSLATPLCLGGIALIAVSGAGGGNQMSSWVGGALQSTLSHAQRWAVQHFHTCRQSLENWLSSPTQIPQQ